MKADLCCHYDSVIHTRVLLTDPPRCNHNPLIHLVARRNVRPKRNKTAPGGTLENERTHVTVAFPNHTKQN